MGIFGITEFYDTVIPKKSKINFVCNEHHGTTGTVPYSTVPLKMSERFKNFESDSQSPPPILVRFSKKLAYSKLQHLKFRVSYIRIYVDMVPAEEFVNPFWSSILAIGFLVFSVAIPKI
jgi:hypothetical protein